MLVWNQIMMCFASRWEQAGSTHWVVGLTHESKANGSHELVSNLRRVHRSQNLLIQ